MKTMLEPTKKHTILKRKHDASSSVSTRKVEKRKTNCIEVEVSSSNSTTDSQKTKGQKWKSLAVTDPASLKKSKKTTKKSSDVCRGFRENKAATSSSIPPAGSKGAPPESSVPTVEGEKRGWPESSVPPVEGKKRLEVLLSPQCQL